MGRTVGRKVFINQRASMFVGRDKIGPIIVIINMAVIGLSSVFMIILGLLWERGIVIFIGLLAALAFVIFLFKIKEKGLSQEP